MKPNSKFKEKRKTSSSNLTHPKTQDKLFFNSIIFIGTFIYNMYYIYNVFLYLVRILSQQPDN